MIETQRLIIRPFSADDTDGLYEYLSDPEVVHFEPYDVFTKEKCILEAARRSTDPAFLAVCLKENRKLIGNIYLSKQEFDTWELGYVFNARYQSMGYATESAAAVIDNVIHTCRARRIVAMCNPANTKSWKLLERLGMRREGHLLQNVYFITDENDNPIWQDTYEYAILASEWNAKHHPK